MPLKLGFTSPLIFRQKMFRVPFSRLGSTSIPFFTFFLPFLLMTFLCLRVHSHKEYSNTLKFNKKILNVWLNFATIWYQKKVEMQKKTSLFSKSGAKTTQNTLKCFLCAYVFVIIFTIHIWMCIALPYHNPREWGDKGMINHNKNYFFIFLVFLVVVALFQFKSLCYAFT